MDPAQQEEDFEKISNYRGDTGGSLWRKWDLHVHSPASIVHHFGDGQQEATWTKYFDGLSKLPVDIKAIAINDYFSIEGYRRVLDAQKDGKLPNLPFILANVELRLTHFVGSAETKRINFHVLFSDEVSADDIQHFFLNRLTTELQLTNGKPWRGSLGTRKDLIALGEAVIAATPLAKRMNESPLDAGFRSASVSHELVAELLEQTVFEGKYLTAIGHAELSQMRWEGGGAAQKRHLSLGADFVLTASPTITKYHENLQQLRDAGVNDRLLHASDAHHYADSKELNKLGQTWCWIKADLTFEGLRRARDRFEDRVFVGDRPPKLVRIAENRTKHIRGISIRKIKGSSLGEQWFNCDLPLNPGLVAIIGNQGNGKSALTDVIALCGNSHTESYSFLTERKFRNQVQRKAEHFQGQLTWEDADTSPATTLDGNSNLQQAERVRYVPQNFFESTTNETQVAEDGSFYREIKKVIFSHVPKDEKRDCATLDELIALHTTATQEKLTILRTELSEINRRLIALEAATDAKEVSRVEHAIERKTQEVSVHRTNPVAIVAPDDTNAAANEEIEGLRTAIAELETQVERLEEERALLKRQRTAIDNAAQGIRNEKRRVEESLKSIGEKLASSGLEIDVAGALVVALNIDPLTDKLAEIEAVLGRTGDALDSDKTESFAFRLMDARSRLHARIEGLEAAASAYQSFRSAQEKWNGTLAELEGTGGIPHAESLAGLKARLLDLQETKPQQIKSLIGGRVEKTKEIFAAIHGLAEAHRSLTDPVSRHLNEEKITRETYKLAFDVSLAQRDLETQFFAHVVQSAGTFVGVGEGRLRLKSVVSKADFQSADGVVAFAEHLLDLVKRNHNNKSVNAVELSSVLKKGTTPEKLYDLIFGLEYVQPTFSLSLNSKPLAQLSPGERGILLLVFYLLVDKGLEPLIIDQPEGNLNNQSIVDHLVPVFKAAKERRQIIIVTHNPNLAVVCDAEQIIHCELDAPNGNALIYRTGSLEHPQFNQLVLDVLEGTAPAFKVRRQTYEACAGTNI